MTSGAGQGATAAPTGAGVQRRPGTRTGQSNPQTARALFPRAAGVCDAPRPAPDILALSFGDAEALAAERFQEGDFRPRSRLLLKQVGISPGADDGTSRGTSAW